MTRAVTTRVCTFVVNVNKPSEPSSAVAGDRLDEVVHGTEGESERRVVHDRHDDDRDVAGRLRALEPLEDLPAVEVGQLDVEDDGGWSERGRPFDPGAPIGGDREREAGLLEVDAQELGRRRVVLDGEDQSLARGDGFRRRGGGRGHGLARCPSQRQQHREPAAATHLGLEVDRAAVRLHQLSRERESQPGALEPGSGGSLLEGLEDRRLIVHRDAHPGIDDLQAGGATIAR